jgi:putative restriction endonuclease
VSVGDVDGRVRTAAFDFLRAQTARHGEVLPFALLSQGFELDGRRVPLLSMQGIFKPAVLPEMPLTIRTKAPVEGEDPPYDDAIGTDGLLRYRYRGTDSQHHDNVGLRLAMQRGVPLIYLFGITPGKYMPIWPVYIVGDHPAQLTFSVAVDAERAPAFGDPAVGLISREARRAYVTVLTKQRLHQQGFRERVLHAYRQQCAVCRLRHEELLQAAHILADGHPLGEPIVPNGLALCGLHHAAFDRHILGITPDHVIKIRRDILRETDGPMLRHGLQEFEDRKITPPRERASWPRPEFLAERFEQFLRAG